VTTACVAAEGGAEWGVPRARCAAPAATGGSATPARTAPAIAEGRATLHAMDVLVLIDKLDDLVHNAKAVPLTDQVRIDREEIYDILDQMRATIPEEIKQARWIVKERQEMLAEAKREVDRLLAEAREQAVREASQTEIVKIAERQAEDIVDDARRRAREMRLEMEDWADNNLASLEVNLERFLTAVKRGRERLHERSQETVVAGIGPNGDIGAADDGDGAGY
jgi:F0F1-type ATP synthase membrane subunit b/b'